MTCLKTTLAVFLPGEYYGQKRLTGYSPQGHKELNMTEVTQHSTWQLQLHCSFNFYIIVKWLTLHVTELEFPKSVSLSLPVYCMFSCILMFSSVAQSCPTLCDPMNCSTPGLTVHHQLQEFLYFDVTKYHIFILF